MADRQRQDRVRKGAWQHWWVWVLAFIFFTTIMVTTAAFTFLSGIHQEVPVEPGEEPVPEPEPGERVNVLFLGVDDAIETIRPRSDTVIVISHDPESGRVSMLSIPRDTRVMIPQRGPDKMGHAHAYGGPRLAMQTVEALLEIPIHYYIRTDLEGFARIVDILGGVEIDVPQRMYYEDPYQDLVIDLMPGPQKLDGEKALQFVRYRGYHDADFGRIRAQQAFISALMQKMLSMKTIFKIPAIAGQLMRHVETNMTASEVLKFSSWVMNVRTEDVMMAMLPGEATYLEQDGQQISYVLVDQAVVREMVNQLFGDAEPPDPVVRVEVYNGSGRSGLARSLAQQLEDMGYEVVTVANASRSDYGTTRVVSGPGGEWAEQRVVQTLSDLGVPAVPGDGDDEYPVAGAQVRIIIGRDFPRSDE